MPFTVVSRGRVADLSRNGGTYRVFCRQCGLLRETTDVGQAKNKAALHNDPAGHSRAV